MNASDAAALDRNKCGKLHVNRATLSGRVGEPWKVGRAASATRFVPLGQFGRDAPLDAID